MKDHPLDCPCGECRPTDSEPKVEQPEPVGWAESYPETGESRLDILVEGSDHTIHVHYDRNDAGEHPVPLYTAVPELTIEQPEPVAWEYKDQGGNWQNCEEMWARVKQTAGYEIRELYTAEPKPTLDELSYHERQLLITMVPGGVFPEEAKAIEVAQTKLRAAFMAQEQGSTEFSLSDEPVTDEMLLDRFKDHRPEIKRLREALEDAEGWFKAIRANLKYGSGGKVEASIGLAEFSAEEIRTALATQEEKNDAST